MNLQSKLCHSGLLLISVVVAGCGNSNSAEEPEDQLIEDLQTQEPLEDSSATDLIEEDTNNDQFSDETGDADDSSGDDLALEAASEKYVSAAGSSKMSFADGDLTSFDPGAFVTTNSEELTAVARSPLFLDQLLGDGGGGVSDPEPPAPDTGSSPPPSPGEIFIDLLEGIADQIQEQTQETNADTGTEQGDENGQESGIQIIEEGAQDSQDQDQPQQLLEQLESLLDESDALDDSPSDPIETDDDSDTNVPADLIEDQESVEVDQSKDGSESTDQQSQEQENSVEQPSDQPTSGSDLDADVQDQVDEQVDSVLDTVKQLLAHDAELKAHDSGFVPITDGSGGYEFLKALGKGLDGVIEQRDQDGADDEQREQINRETVDQVLERIDNAGDIDLPEPIEDSRRDEFGEAPPEVGHPQYVEFVPAPSYQNTIDNKRTLVTLLTGLVEGFTGEQPPEDWLENYFAKIEDEDDPSQLKDVMVGIPISLEEYLMRLIEHAQNSGRPLWVSSNIFFDEDMNTYIVPDELPRDLEEALARREHVPEDEDVETREFRPETYERYEQPFVSITDRSDRGELLTSIVRQQNDETIRLRERTLLEFGPGESTPLEQIEDGENGRIEEKVQVRRCIITREINASDGVRDYSLRRTEIIEILLHLEIRRGRAADGSDDEVIEFQGRSQVQRLSVVDEGDWDEHLGEPARLYDDKYEFQSTLRRALDSSD